MSDMEHQIELIPPTVEEYQLLRNKTNWGIVESTLVEHSLENSLFHVVVRESEKIIGMARVIGDGSLYFYIQDVVVGPEHQNKGVGTAMMQQIELYLAAVASNGATIGLLSAKGKEQFYARFGYLLRPSDHMGNGMCKYVREKP